MDASSIFIGIAVFALVSALIVGNLKKMPFKKIESVLEKIEKKEAHINGTAIGLFFIGLVLLLGLYFTSDDFRDFSTLYVKPREVCRLPGGWGLGGSVRADCDYYTSSLVYSEEKVFDTNEIRDKVVGSLIINQAVKVNWWILLLVGSGASWVAIRKGWVRKLVIRLRNRVKNP